MGTSEEKKDPSPTSEVREFEPSAHMSWVIYFGLSILLVAGPSCPVAADAGSAEPLVVPRGPGPRPERTARLSTLERVDRAHAELSDRGYTEFPILAWALLERAREESVPDETISRALTLAPNTPSVRFEAARALHSPLEFARAWVAFARSLPALLWLITVLGAAAAVGVTVAVAAVVLAAFVRVLPLHGHRFGHLIHSQHPPLWPGILVLLAALALLARLGLGPVLVIGVAGLLTNMSLKARQGGHVVVALLLLGLLAGPLINQWSRLVALTGQEQGLFAAWRIDHGAQPLPADRERLQQGHAAKPHDAFLALALATAWLREGELARAENLLKGISERSSKPVRARVWNLLGIVRLALGDVGPAIGAFETARSAEESAPILYNLSQAHGRGLNLMSQTNYFKLARELDADLIQRRTLNQSSSVHHYLIHTPIPLLMYLEGALRDSPQAGRVARETRRWLLGAQVPSWAWLALPLMGVLGILVRGKPVPRCVSCNKPVCRLCSPAGSSEPACARCAELMVPDPPGEAHPQRRQLRGERKRRRWIASVLSAAGLLLPGIERIREGHFPQGATRAFLAGTGVALVFLAELLPFGLPFAIPAPFEVGGVGTIVLVVSALMLTVPLYTWGVLEWARRRAHERQAA